MDLGRIRNAWLEMHKGRVQPVVCGMRLPSSSLYGSPKCSHGASWGLALMLLMLPALSHAQVFGGQAVMQGQRVEMGINQCGVYRADSSTLAGLGFGGPLGPFSGLDSTALGAMYLEAGQACGDYWRRHDEFGFQLVDRRASNRAACEDFDMPGSITAYTFAAGVHTVVWQGTATIDSNTIGVKQTTTLGINDGFVRTEVTLTNLSPHPLDKLYYARRLKADNDISKEDSKTSNQVLSQASDSVGMPTGLPSAVLATGFRTGCQLVLASNDYRSRAAITTAHFGDYYFHPKRMWNDGNDFSHDPADSIRTDFPIALAFRIDDLNPGATTSFKYAHIFDLSEMSLALSDSVATACPIPYGLSADVGSTKARLRWTKDPMHMGFRLFGGPMGSPPVIRHLTADSIRIKGLSPGTTYQWTVRARCVDGAEPVAAPVQTFTTATLRDGALALDPILLHPNPASGVFALSGESLSGYRQVSVHDGSGRILQVLPVQGDPMHMDASAWAPGIYLLRLTGEGPPRQFRLLVP